MRLNRTHWTFTVLSMKILLHLKLFIWYKFILLSLSAFVTILPDDLLPCYMDCRIIIKCRVWSYGGSMFSLYKYIFGAKSIKYSLKSPHCWVYYLTGSWQTEKEALLLIFSCFTPSWMLCVVRYLTLTAATLTESLATPVSPSFSFPFQFGLLIPAVSWSKLWGPDLCTYLHPLSA